MPSHYDEISSPDPLQDSVTYSSPTKSRGSTRIRRSLPLQGSSPRKQTFELDVGNEISPQKIRVTVEADNSDKENGPRAYGSRNSMSPTPFRAQTIHRKEKTTTTTVPVKGLSDSENDTSQDPLETPKRGRGRPRKSVGTLVTSKNQPRKLTPSGRRRRTLGSLVDGEDEEDWNFVIGAGVEMGRGKGQSRSRSVKSASRKIATPAAQTEIPPDKLTSSATSRRGKGRRKTLTPGDILVLEDEVSTGVRGHDLDQRDRTTRRALVLASGNATPKPPSPPITTASGEDGSGVSFSKITPTRRLPLNTERSSLKNRCISATRTRGSTRTDSPIFPLQGSPETVNLQESANLVLEDNVQYEDEEDGLGEVLEFDTILESEGFSMISVDSVPSLREHLSSPNGPLQDIERNAPAPINKIISSLSQTIGTGGENSFSSASPEILQAATPGTNLASGNHLVVRKAYIGGEGGSFSGMPLGNLDVVTPVIKTLNSKLLSVREVERNAIEDSFSSIPPEVLEAATPVHHALRNHLQSLKSLETRVRDDSFSSIPPEVLEAATPGRLRKKNQIWVTQDEAPKTCDSSLSSIPSTLLEAATSAQAPHNDPGLAGNKSERDNEITLMDSKLLRIDFAAATSSRMRASSRLLTPEETPSPPQGLEKQETSAYGPLPSNALSGEGLDERQPSEGSSVVYPQIRSSPPSVIPQRFTYSTHFRQHQLLPPVTKTPSIVFSSPSLPPLVQQKVFPERIHTLSNAQPGSKAGKSISPSLRAGKALQDLTAPDITAGRSAGRRSQSLGSPFKIPEVIGNPKIGSGGALGPDMPVCGVHEAQQKTSKVKYSVFGGFSDDTKRELRKSLIMGEELAKSLENTQVTKWSIRKSVSREEDPFSSADQQLPSLSPDHNHDYSLELPGNNLDSQQGTDCQFNLIRNYDEMSWQPENNIRVKKSLEVGKLDSNTAVTALNQHRDAPRTSGLCNGLSQLWQDPREEQWAHERAVVSQQIESASTSQVIVLSSDSPNDSESQGEISDDEDIWQTEARQTSSLLRDPSEEQPHGQKPAGKPRRSKIPSLWRENSRRLTYSDELAQVSSSQPSVVTAIVYPSQLLPESNSERPKNGAPSSILRVEKRTKPFDKMSSNSLPKASQVTVRRTIIPPTRISDLKENLSSPIDASFFRQIPQKINFVPRPRNTARLDLSALLASSPVKIGQDESTSIDASATLISQLLRSGEGEPSTSTQQASSSPEKSTACASSLPFEILDSRDQTRTDKSPISSPEPIRTSHDYEVDFSTASVSDSLSQNESSQSSIFLPAIPGPLIPNPTATPQKSCFRTPIKTKSPKSVIFHSPTPSPPPLSSTAWSKNHWRLLDALYQDYFELGPQCYGDGEVGRTSRFVGKTAVSQGESLTLEAWHMDIVAAFREEVPGWEEGVIAKRLFAIIVGEKKRREGKIGD